MITLTALVAVGCLLLNEEQTDAVEVSLVNDADVGEVTLLLLSLLCQDVTFVSMFSFNLSCSGKGEPFFGTGISLNFWHFAFCLKKLFICSGNRHLPSLMPFFFFSQLKAVAE